MKVYNYCQKTKEYTKTTNAAENPLEKGNYLIPSNATSIPINENKNGFTQVFDVIDKKWNYIENNRGKIVYDIQTKKEIKVAYIGKIKENHTKIKPTTEFDVWNGNEWVIDLDKAKRPIFRLLKTKISSKITSGFTFNDDVIKTDLVSQQNGNSNYALAVRAMNKAGEYATNTTYKKNSVIVDNGVYYITLKGGTTGDTKPTFPTEFKEAVTDNGGVEWYKFGLLVSILVTNDKRTTKSSVKYFTPQNMEDLYIDFNEITTNYRNLSDFYKQKIEAVETIEELDALKSEIEGI